MEYLNQKLKISDLKKFAKEKGGKCLSSEFDGVYSRYDWKCKLNHTWTASFYSIYHGSWCEKCHVIEKIKTSLQRINEFAESKGGKLLTKKVNSYDDLIKLQCANGHTWEIRPVLKSARLWCPDCAKNLNK